MVRYNIEIGQQEQDILKEIVLASDKMERNVNLQQGYRL